MANSNRILLICLPWASIEQPNLAFGLIKALLAREGIGTDIKYLNLDFARTVGLERYRSLKDKDVLACDWIFSESLFGRFREPDEFISFLAQRGGDHPDLHEWAHVQRAARPFIELCASSIPWENYEVVGFTTSMVQLVSSLSLAKRAKEANPRLRVVFGGSNCEGEMGQAVLETFDFIDVVVRRDCDAFVGTLFRRLLDNTPLSGLPICYRENGKISIAPMPPIFHDLDDNPYPDYDDYFTELARMPYRDRVRVNIVFEGSRGCWYGEKVPCTFCAVNGSSMEYRSKTPSRLVAELKYLSDRHQVSWFGAADNILDNRGQERLCQLLAEQIPKAKIFFDVKSNLTRKQLVSMKHAGIDEVQPGIESFSSRILKLMKKGVTGIRNIHVLRMFSEVGIWPMWNYLYGFPGEKVEDYRPLLKWINPALFHLPAPYVGFGLSMMRFSEYFNNPEAMGVRIRGPLKHYQFIFDLPEHAISELAYYFDYDYIDKYDPSTVAELVASTTKAWNEAYYIRKVSLSSRVHGHSVLIEDTRSGTLHTHHLTGLSACIYRLLERPRRAEALGSFLAKTYPAKYLGEGGAHAIRAILQELYSTRLIFIEDDLYLAIAVPQVPHEFWLPWLASDAVSENAGEHKLYNIGRPTPSLLHWKVEHLYQEK